MVIFNQYMLSEHNHNNHPSQVPISGYPRYKLDEPRLSPNMDIFHYYTHSSSQVPLSLCFVFIFLVFTESLGV